MGRAEKWPRSTYYSSKYPFKAFDYVGLGFSIQGLEGANSAEDAFSALKRSRASGVKPLAPAIHSAPKQNFELLSFLFQKGQDAALNTRTGTTLLIGRKGGKAGLWLVLPSGPKLIESNVNELSQVYESGDVAFAVVSRSLLNRHAVAFKPGTGEVLWRKDCDAFAVNSK